MRKIVRDRILEKCNYRCMKCGIKDNLEVDHIIPLSRGGREDEDNMQILCSKCNRKKHNYIDFRQFFIIGENPEYIFTKKDFPINAWSAKEFKEIFLFMFKENDRLFGIEREYIKVRY
ncbi:hypothetical protein ES705_37251 [subsurface metagenome]|jgi:5-methylcytosine-specific restriction endonuclease McrA